MRSADTLVTGNDRRFVCHDCRSKAATPRHYYASSVTFDGEFINTVELQQEVSALIATLNANIDTYKAWLNAKQEQFELYFYTEELATEDAFNQLNLIVAKIKQGVKMLTSWYMTVQEIVADVWDGIETYANAKNVLESYRHEEEEDGPYYSGGGLSLNPVKLAKRNRVRVKVLNRQRTKALAAETFIRQALFRLDAELNSFNQGIVRAQNGKFVNLLELGTVIDSLYEGDSPLVRVQHSLADRINSAAVKVKLRRAVLPEIKTMADRVPFVRNLETTTANELLQGDTPTDEEGVMRWLKGIADSALYTYRTGESLEKAIAHAKLYVKTPVNRDQMTDIVRTIRGNGAKKVLERLQLSVRRPEDKIANVQWIRRILREMHVKDRPVLERQFEALLGETMQQHEPVDGAAEALDHAAADPAIGPDRHSTDTEMPTATPADVDRENEYTILKELYEIADTQLYTDNTGPDIDRQIRHAETYVKTDTNRTRLSDVTATIRGNTPARVMDALLRSIDGKQRLYETMARIRKLLNALHDADRAAHERLLRDALEAATRAAETSLLQQQHRGEPADDD